MRKICLTQTYHQTKTLTKLELVAWSLVRRNRRREKVRWKNLQDQRQQRRFKQRWSKKNLEKQAITRAQSQRGKKKTPKRARKSTGVRKVR